jgi:hypothetical protein
MNTTGRIQRIVIGTLICAGLVRVCIAAGAPAESQEGRARAMLLLDKYADTWNRIRSFQMKGRVSNSVRSTFFEKGRRTFSYEVAFDIRFDGERLTNRTRLWGQPAPKVEYSKDAPYYQSSLWNGRKKLSYYRTNDLKVWPNGRVTITDKAHVENVKRRGNLLRDTSLASLMGYSGGGTRVDALVRGADSVSVRDKTERVGGSQCHIIEANTKLGKYTLWIDPEHGYHVAKMQVEAGPGDVLSSNVMLQKNERLVDEQETVRFREVDGVWIPVEAIRRGEREYRSGDATKTTSHVKISEVLLNPDHDAMDSFVPDDIENGAKVYIVKNEKLAPGRHTWRDSRVVDEKGGVILDFRPRASNTL